MTTTEVCEPTAPTPADDPSMHPLPPEIVPDELATVASLAAVEQGTVDAYSAIGDARTTGSLGDLPPALAQYLATALDHHQTALALWNRVLVAARRPAVTTTPADLAASITEQVRTVTDAATAAGVALSLETVAAATYLDALGRLVSEPAILLAGAILPVDRQHMSFLLFVLGRDPAPDTFAGTDGAYVATSG